MRRRSSDGLNGWQHPAGTTQGIERKVAGYFSLRVGVYRVIYRIEHEQHVIFVEKIGHRREVYEE
jgi:mRNA interferase RelE/StbE